MCRSCNAEKAPLWGFEVSANCILNFSCSRDEYLVGETLLHGSQGDQSQRPLALGLVLTYRILKLQSFDMCPGRSCKVEKETSALGMEKNVESRSEQPIVYLHLLSSGRLPDNRGLSVTF